MLLGLRIVALNRQATGEMGTVKDQLDKNAYDVAIIGGGPGGTTLGTLLKKYNPALRVVIFEKEKFPRDHIGESQLPPISAVLDEMGCWDKVEAAARSVPVGPIDVAGIKGGGGGQAAATWPDFNTK